MRVLHSAGSGAEQQEAGQHCLAGLGGGSCWRQQNLQLIQLKSVISAQPGPGRPGGTGILQNEENWFSLVLPGSPWFSLVLDETYDRSVYLLTAARICRNFTSLCRPGSDYLFLFSSQIKIFLVFSPLISWPD